MKRKLRMFVFAAIFTLVSYNGLAQVSVSYYSSSLSKIGMAYNFNDRLWSEVKLYSNTIAEYITPEIVMCYNVVNKQHHNVYAGLGVSVNYFEAVVIPIGVQFSPFEKLDRFSMHIELMPTINFVEEFLLQSSWGIRYTFGKDN